MVGWHHQFNGHETGHALGDGEGQEGLVSKQSGMTWQLRTHTHTIVQTHTSLHTHTQTCLPSGSDSKGLKESDMTWQPHTHTHTHTPLCTHTYTPAWCLRQ